MTSCPFASASSGFTSEKRSVGDDAVGLAQIDVGGVRAPLLAADHPVPRGRQDQARAARRLRRHLGDNLAARGGDVVGRRLARRQPERPPGPAQVGEHQLAGAGQPVVEGGVLRPPQAGQRRRDGAPVGVLVGLAQRDQPLSSRSPAPRRADSMWCVKYDPSSSLDSCASSAAVLAARIAAPCTRAAGISGIGKPAVGCPPFGVTAPTRVTGVEHGDTHRRARAHQRLAQLLVAELLVAAAAARARRRAPSSRRAAPASDRRRRAARRAPAPTAAPPGSARAATRLVEAAQLAQHVGDAIGVAPGVAQRSLTIGRRRGRDDRESPGDQRREDEGRGREGRRASLLVLSFPVRRARPSETAARRWSPSRRRSPRIRSSLLGRGLGDGCDGGGRERRRRPEDEQPLRAGRASIRMPPGSGAPDGGSGTL